MRKKRRGEGHLACTSPEFVLSEFVSIFLGGWAVKKFFLSRKNKEAKREWGEEIELGPESFVTKFEATLTQFCCPSSIWESSEANFVRLYPHASQLKTIPAVYGWIFRCLTEQSAMSSSGNPYESICTYSTYSSSRAIRKNMNISSSFLSSYRA